jgi:hypothetical protein
MDGMDITIQVQQPVTAAALAVYVDKGSPTLPNEVAFLADGKEILRAAIKRQDGQQKFDLKEPATFKALAMKVLSIQSGEAAWGRIDEIQALDKDGKPLPLFSERRVPTVVPQALEDVYQWCKGRDSSRPVLLDLAAFAAKAPAGWEPDAKKKLYGDYLKSCDAAGLEASDADGPEGVGAAVAALKELAGASKPVFACLRLEAAAGGGAISPADLRAKVWAALIGGAGGIGYRIPAGDPRKPGSGLPQALGQEIQRLSKQIAGLSAALLAAPAKAKVEMSLADNSSCHLKATELDGAIYVFAQRPSAGARADGPQAAKGTIKVAGLKAGTRVEVVDEDRNRTADEGQFADDFPPLAEHVYRIAP